jgi:hypothetical protein
MWQYMEPWREGLPAWRSVLTPSPPNNKINVRGLTTHDLKGHCHEKVC